MHTHMHTFGRTVAAALAWRIEEHSSVCTVCLRHSTAERRPGPVWPGPETLSDASPSVASLVGGGEGGGAYFLSKKKKTRTQSADGGVFSF